MKTIVFSGPESTGKTTLANEVSRRCGVRVVGEVARTYLQNRIHADRYLPGDLYHIAVQQVSREQQVREQLAVKPEAQLMLADTDLQVIRIWWQERYGPLPDWLTRMSRAQLEGASDEHSRHYLICRPDIQWQPDPQRENPHDRDRLFELYLADAQAWQLDHRIVSGTGDKRLENTLKLLLF